MKAAILVAAASLASAAAAANPVSWTQLSPRAEMAARIHADSSLAARSITSDAQQFVSSSYDYIVVGAGTAGLAVAARLSENGKYSVGVLEAGSSGYNVSIIDIPGQFGADLGTKYDWNYTTVPANGVPAVGWPRGKVLGGSSALNFLVWDRSAKQEIDAWEELGNKGWNWNNLYGNMRKSEHFHAPSQRNADLLGVKPVPSDYGLQGPVQVAFPNYISQQVQRWIGALSSLGIPKNDQPLSGKNVGVSQQPSNINPHNYTRSYSAAAYLFPNQARKNLKVLTDALATKVEFDTSKKNQLRATGVTFTSNGNTYTVKAKKEVIVSGGTVNTPQILELSGIGNKEILDKAGVKTLYENNNVGENLADHTYSATVYKLKPGFQTLDSLRSNQTFAAAQAAAYAANQTSIFTETVPSISYVSLTRVVGESRAKALISDVSKYVHQSAAPYKAALKKQLEFLTKYPDTIGQMELIGIDGYFAGTGKPNANETYFTILAANQHLFSRGNIHIQSSDPTKYPLINSNYFSVPFDLEISTAGTNYTRKIGLSKAYSDMVVGEYWPGTDVDQEQYTKTTSVTEYHPIGTASMLPRNKGGVVDSSLVVYGTQNLRVVDASIIPLHIAAHIQATIYGVAEYAAEIIKREA